MWSWYGSGESRLKTPPLKVEAQVEVTRYWSSNEEHHTMERYFDPLSLPMVLGCRGSSSPSLWISAAR
jgi:hypothetical protein